MTNQEQLKDLKTEQVKSKQDIGLATKMCRYYQYRPMMAKELDLLINSDWCTADFLTDIYKDPETKEEQREAVAFIAITQLAPQGEKAVNSRTKIDLEVSAFATLPFYDVEVAVEWADYRIRRALEYIARAERILWAVDERNMPLQLALRDIGYKVLLPDRDSDCYIFTK